MRRSVLRHCSETILIGCAGRLFLLFETGGDCERISRRFPKLNIRLSDPDCHRALRTGSDDRAFEEDSVGPAYGLGEPDLLAFLQPAHLDLRLAATKRRLV